MAAERLPDHRPEVGTRRAQRRAAIQNLTAATIDLSWP
jgi:hypothetical protein